MGSTRVRGVFDAFGKLSRFTVANGRVCFASRMMQTAWYNTSLAESSIGPALLFYETEPPRGFSGMKNVNAPNDNSYVNTMTLGGRYFGVTDSKVVVEFDPASLAITQDVKFKDHLDKMTVGLGSAHPLPEPNATRGCMLGVRPEAVALVDKKVLVYRVCDDDPTRRIEVAKLHTGAQLPYFHSFGVTRRYAILPMQHITFDVTALMLKGYVKAALKHYHAGEKTRIELLPIDGHSEPLTFELPDDLYFLHAINSFENATSIVFDSTVYRVNPLFQDSQLSAFKNATMRDTSTETRGVATRFALHVAGPRKGAVDVTPLSHVNRSTDFPKINMRFHAEEYCLYWAVEWMHDDRHMSRMAIVRQDICHGMRRYWYREGSFPSEPTFVPRTQAGSAAEDDGVLVFTILDGSSGTTRLMFVDAKTMETVSEAHAPKEAAIGYTVHGQWFSSLTPAPV